MRQNVISQFPEMQNTSGLVFIVILILVIVIIVVAAWWSSNNQTVKESQPIDNKFKVNMRGLWMQHVTLTRLVISDAINNADCLDSNLALLSQVQRDLGSNLSTKLGQRTGKNYTDLLVQHINDIIKVVTFKLQKKEIQSIVNDLTTGKKDIVGMLIQEVNGFDQVKLDSLWTTYIEHTRKEVEHIIDKDCAASNNDYLNLIDCTKQLSDYMADCILRS